MLKKVSVSINNKTLFSDISLSPKAGQWVCILGESGVGKSTVIRLMAGLETAGIVTGEINKPSNVAWMGQQDLLYPWATVLENILLPITMTENVTYKDIKKAKLLLKEVGVVGKDNDKPDKLSGGQRQRVALVRTLMMDADVILMDEPFSALDSMTKRSCQDLFYKMLENKTVVMVTHDVMEASRLADVVYVMIGRKPYLKKGVSLTSIAPRIFESSDVLASNKKLWKMLEEAYV